MEHVIVGTRNFDVGSSHAQGWIAAYEMNRIGVCVRALATANIHRGIRLSLGEISLLFLGKPSKHSANVFHPMVRKQKTKTYRIEMLE